MSTLHEVRAMRALVVYESMFGNTEQVAQAVAEGLRAHARVRVVAVGDAPAELEGVDMVVIGGPTHAFSMTRRSTREDAVRQGATGAVDTGVREWLAALPTDGGNVAVATFDTRVDRVRRLPGSAARRAAKLARRHGLAPVARPESFFVADVSGPLLAGELSRARRWGQTLGCRAQVEPSARASGGR